MSSTPRNFLLSLLRPAERVRVVAVSRLRTLIFKEILFRPDEVVETVVFPESGVISLISQAPDGVQAEAGVIGWDGGAGLLEGLGSGVMASEAVVQTAGTGWFVPLKVCRDLHETSPHFRHGAALVAELQALEARQSMLCRSFHVTEARLARWLLEMRDKGGGDSESITLTQEFMAMMLGVQRTTVSTLAHAMQAEGLIRYSRGHIELNDIAGLEARACACRGEIRNQHRRIIGSPDAPGADHGPRPRDAAQAAQPALSP